MSRKPSRSLISFRMRAAISRCLGVSLGASSPNHFTASLMPNSVVWLMLRPAIFTASASGLRRAPLQVSHLLSCWKRSSSSRTHEESVSFQRRSRLGITPSNGLVV